MGFFNWLTGAKSVDKTLDIIDKSSSSIASGLDKMFYTKEEKAEHLMKRLEISERVSKTHIDLMKATADENTTRSVTRRIIAVSIMAFTLFLIVAVSVIYKIDPEWAAFILKVTEYFQFGWAFIAVVVFFFGNHMITRFKK